MGLDITYRFKKTTLSANEIKDLIIKKFLINLDIIEEDIYKKDILTCFKWLIRIHDYTIWIIIIEESQLMYNKPEIRIYISHEGNWDSQHELDFFWEFRDLIDNFLVNDLKIENLERE